MKSASLRFAVLLTALLWVPASASDHDHDEGARGHDDAIHRDGATHHDHDEAPPRHQPPGADGHAHAHPAVDLSHPIVTESPVPETHFKLRYLFGDAGDAKEHTATAELEYAFTQNVSAEAVVPYT